MGAGAEARWIRERIAAENGLAAPHLLDIEVTSALRRLAASRHLSVAQASTALETYLAFRIDRYPHLPFLRTVWERREGLTADDGAYVVLAGVLDCPLVTTDRRLARAAQRQCRTEVPPPR